MIGVVGVEAAREVPAGVARGCAAVRIRHGGAEAAAGVPVDPVQARSVVSDQGHHPE